MPTFDSRLTDAKQHFKLSGNKYTKILQDECNNVQYFSYTGYILIGRDDMFLKIQKRINNLEKNYNVLFYNVIAFKWYLKWLRVCLTPPYGKLYIFYMNRFKCNQFV